MNRETIERFRPTTYAAPQPQATFRIWTDGGERILFHTAREAIAYARTDALDGVGTFGLEEFETDGRWHEWYNEEDQSITDIVGF